MLEILKADKTWEEEKARKGIAQMREGIEKAASQVLGDETEALRAAAESLEKLNQDLENELESKTDQTGAPRPLWISKRTSACSLRADSHPQNQSGL